MNVSRETCRKGTMEPTETSQQQISKSIQDLTEALKEKGIDASRLIVLWQSVMEVWIAEQDVSVGCTSCNRTSYRVKNIVPMLYVRQQDTYGRVSLTRVFTSVPVLGESFLWVTPAAYKSFKEMTAEEQLRVLCEVRDYDYQRAMSRAKVAGVSLLSR